MNLKLFRTISDLRSYLRTKPPSTKVGFVPTMGALHIGHLSLVELASQKCNCVGVSIFVNPTQFLPGEDFSKYPRTLETDLAKLGNTACEWVFVPEVEEMYPKGADTIVNPGWLGTILEGAYRPGHFSGVATIVTRLYEVVQPDAMVFGQKDAQQCAIINKIVRDLAIPVEIIIGSTIRESDGLAYSSRNRYLSTEERTRACGLIKSLRSGIAALQEGDNFEIAEYKMYECMQTFLPDHIDYLTFVDNENFSTPSSSRTVRAVGAVRFGTTRLIDNISLNEM